MSKNYIDIVICKYVNIKYLFIFMSVIIWSYPWTYQKDSPVLVKSPPLGTVTDRDKFKHFKEFVNIRNLIMLCCLILRADATLVGQE